MSKIKHTLTSSNSGFRGSGSGMSCTDDLTSDLQDTVIVWRGSRKSLRVQVKKYKKKEYQIRITIKLRKFLKNYKYVNCFKSIRPSITF